MALQSKIRMMKDEYGEEEVGEEEVDEEEVPRPIPSLKKRAEELAGSSTLHGFHYVIGADRAICRRVIWFFLMLIGFSFLVHQLYASCSKLLAYEDVLNRDIIETKEQKFPAVTICNRNMLQRSLIKGTDIQTYLDHINYIGKLLYGKKLKPLETLNGSVDMEKVVKEYGHKLEDMLFLCGWKGNLCTYDQFTTRYSNIVSVI